MIVVDSHIHCGVQVVDQPWSVIRPLLEVAGIQRACLFAPVEDIYDRYRPEFVDDPDWRACRRRAHNYLLNLAADDDRIIPYLFVWNDFAVDELERGFKGIKWHRHHGEPEYQYDHPRCEEMIAAICERRLPIVLEETFANTQRFVRRIAGRTPVIIPHLGMLNGGFERLERAGIWDLEAVYADTALASEADIGAYLERHGPDRLVFGSDWPFGLPAAEVAKLEDLEIADEALEAICGRTILRLTGEAP